MWKTVVLFVVAICLRPSGWVDETEQEMTLAQSCATIDKFGYEAECFFFGISRRI